MIRYDEYVQLKKNEKIIDKKLKECFCCFFKVPEEEKNEKSELYVEVKYDMKR